MKPSENRTNTCLAWWGNSCECHNNSAWIHEFWYDFLLYLDSLQGSFWSAQRNPRQMVAPPTSNPVPKNGRYICPSWEFSSTPQGALTPVKGTNFRGVYLTLRCAKCDAGHQLIDEKCTYKAEIWELILLMLQKSGDHRLGCVNVNNGINYLSTGWPDFFHQL